MREAQEFRDRIAYKNNKVLITQEKLTEISNEFMNSSYMQMLGTKTDIDIKNILLRCKKSAQEGKKYIITPRDEDDKNEAKLVPLEEFALMQIFNINGVKADEATVLLDGMKVNLRWSNRNSSKEKIEISFQNVEGTVEEHQRFEI